MHRIAVCNRSLFHHAGDGKGLGKPVARHEFGLQQVELHVGECLVDGSGDGEGIRRRAVCELILLRHLVRERHGDAHRFVLSRIRRIVEGCNRAVRAFFLIGQHDLGFAVQIGHIAQFIAYVRAVIRSGDLGRVLCIAQQHRPRVFFIRLYRKRNRRPHRVARRADIRCRSANERIYANRQIRERELGHPVVPLKLYVDLFIGYASAVPFCSN